jgi:SAM-dependent methyltransferase
VSGSVLDRVVCVGCGGPLDPRPASPTCASCGASYPRVGPIPVLMPRASAHVELWRRQLALLRASGATTQAGLETAAAAPELPPAGRTRLAAMARAVRDQVDDFVAVLGPALGGPLPGDASGLPRGVVEYSYYLFRDWGWPLADERQDENAAAFEALRAVAPGPLGRVLVLGAGACRLAYDLHRAGATETAVVDIDPYLFVIAEAVVRGAAVRLTEASLNVLDAARVSQAWTLRAPHGPLDARFSFALADGLGPPFADETFDTVVTPWFIDRVPTDVAGFLATVRRLLRPGGRWLNHGPLLYPPETPLPRRYGRDELFALAEGAGLRLDHAVDASRPYLVSPLTGAGKIERVLTFSAARAPD